MLRTVGLITEYNPFHNGHLHHLQESLRVSGADASVAVMSGHFLQRGEPALLDKWARTEMALAAGVDLVLELPFPFACSSAPHFARGAVQTLEALGVVDSFCFGSEVGGLELLDAIATLLVERSGEVEAATARKLKQGMNYPTARAGVLAEMMPDLPADQLGSPNNILGIAYLKALKLTGSRIRPHTIPRLGPGYHETFAAGRIASATGIREMMRERGEAVGSFLPAACAAILDEAAAGGRLVDMARLQTVLEAFLLQEPSSLAGLCQVEEGLDRRLHAAAMSATGYRELCRGVKSRQWTLTRIQRILSYVLLQVTSAEMAAWHESGPLYLRLLGHTAKGEAVLAAARTRKTLPMIGDPARASGLLRRHYAHDPIVCRLAEKMLACDLRATRLHGLLCGDVAEHRNRDFFEPVVRRG